MERRLITTDCHIAPPYSLVEQLPESYRQHFPRLERRTEGTFLKQPRVAQMAAVMADVDTGGIEVADDRVSLAARRGRQRVRRGHAELRSGRATRGARA